ncbi:FAD:protein FMN transferase [Sulfurimonas microaerophilic]|uniref:FAD:protein FMN transferase n=1 Tax=Sulfurimonas microaerophilic TaxID=3058392 RepID=UPI002714946A|nr:FAD:protein FMN transferase [Sulfurimonas sp. hsl 1-7]
MKTFLLFLLTFSFLEATTLMREKILMGTFIGVEVEKEKIDLSKQAFQVAQDIENSISTYKQNSIISKLNRNKMTSLDQYSYEVLAISKKVYKQTEGYFDPTVGSITKDLYKFGEGELIPYPTLLEHKKIALAKVKFNKKFATLDKDLKVDFGGMGKGYAVDKMAQVLKQNGVKKFVIWASGDIRCLETCKIKVNNPFEETPLTEFSTKRDETAISTSGNYNRYVTSVKNNHLIDPKTKRSQQLFISVTLIAEIDNALLDAYATAVSVMPKAKAYSFLQKHNIAYIILENDGSIHISKNISDYVTELSFQDTFKQPKKYERNK